MRGALRLVRFRGAAGGGPRLGLEEAPGGDLVDLNAAEPALPLSMREFLELGPRGLELAQRALESGQHRVARGATRLLAPVGDPEKLICVGLNYRDHCEEQGARVPKEPIIFSKFPSAITGPFDDIVLPQDSTEVDWEVELAAVIGKRGRHIEESAALEHVVGFTVANDVSARDWQLRNGRQWLLGKTFDTFCPLGPALVTREAVKGGAHGGTVPMSPCVPSHRPPQPVDPLQHQWAPDAGQQHPPPRLWGARPHCLGVPVRDTGPWGHPADGDSCRSGVLSETPCLP
ncbi:fumarylacetoacetate hydrolase domain-containing protein 2-like isoform X2 [Pseudopipra pipra]|uniref:fumarylacetoacetate hydrolase domain-containing protein 2-like isoform X2 n=1 Tax=Pseudopipra pipra TaxID=415032 RepID=UPI0031390FEA